MKKHATWGISIAWLLLTWGLAPTRSAEPSCAPLGAPTRPHLKSGGCGRLPDGVIRLRVSGTGKHACEGMEDERLPRSHHLSLVQLPKDGQGPGTPLKAPPALAKQLQEYDCIGTEGSFVRVAGSGDLDGDGAPELLLLLVKTYHEDLTRPELQIWTMREGTLVRYARDPKLPVLTFARAPEEVTNLVRDVDGDGRPDLFHPGPYVTIAVDARNLIGEEPIPPRFLYHAQADGSFRADDEVAKAHLARYCGAAPPRLRDRPPKGEEKTLKARLTRRVLCARAYGVSAKALLQELTPQCPAWNASDFEDSSPESQPEQRQEKVSVDCPDWLVKLVQITPPLRLSRQAIPAVTNERPKACRTDKMAFTQRSGCVNDDGVEFCIPADDQGLVEELARIDPSIHCQNAMGRAQCALDKQRLCIFPVHFADCTHMHGALKAAAWARLCRVAALPQIRRIVPRWLE